MLVIYRAKPLPSIPHTPQVRVDNLEAVSTQETFSGTVSADVAGESLPPEDSSPGPNSMSTDEDIPIAIRKAPRSCAQYCVAESGVTTDSLSS